MSNSDFVPPTPSFLSKRRLGWAALAAVLGCGVVCAAPLLLALGAGSAALTALAGVLKPGAELMGGGAFAGAMVFMAIRARAPKGAKGEAACGCTPSEPSGSQIYRSPVAEPNEPVACTVNLNDKAALQAGIDTYREAFTHLVASERFQGGFRWTFRNAPGLRERLGWLSEAEHGCCRFLSFDVRSQGDQILWETRAEAHAASALEEYFHLPQRLLEETQPGHDLEHLEREATRAGIRFTSRAEEK